MQADFNRVILDSDQGDSFEISGAQFSIKVDSTETGASFGVITCSAPPEYPGFPEHIHRQTIEVLYVLEGQLTVLIADATKQVGAGNLVFIPAEVVHAFSNPHQIPAKFLLISAPGGLEQYLRELATAVDNHGHPLPKAVMANLASVYDWEILASPIE